MGQSNTPTFSEVLVRKPGKALLTVAETAALLGISASAAAGRIQRGNFPVPIIRLGRRRYVATDSLLAYLRSLPMQGAK